MNIVDMHLDLVTVSVMGLGFLIVALFWQAARKGLSCLDLITDKGSGKMSLTKVMNVLGGIVGSWAVMHQAIDGRLSWDIFLAFLAYCGGSHGWSSYLSAKFRPGEPQKD